MTFMRRSELIDTNRPSRAANDPYFDNEKERSLLDDSRYDAIPLWKHENILIRWPMYTLHIGWIILSMHNAHFLSIFLVPGIVLGAYSKDPIVTFIINSVALISLNALFRLTIKLFSLRLSKTRDALIKAMFANSTIFYREFAPLFYDEF